MMRRIKILCLLLAILILLTTCVFAADYAGESQIRLEGESTAKPGETKTATLKISSQNIEVGVVSGKIEKNANIESMIVTGKNNWNLTYNQETGVFNVYKAEGAKFEEILNIEYTLTNQEGIGTITIKDIDMTTIDYETTKIASISKEITVKKEQENPGQENPGQENPGQENPGEEPETVILTGIKVKSAPSKVTYKVGERFDKAGLVVEAEYSNGTTKEITNYTCVPTEGLKLTDTKITITYKEGEVTKTVEQSITVVAASGNNEPSQGEPEKDSNSGTGNKNDKDNTKADKEIIHAGLENYLILIIAIVVIISVISYKKYKQYKNI